MQRNVLSFVAGVLVFMAANTFAATPPPVIPTLAITNASSLVFITLTATPFSKWVLEAANNLESSPTNLASNQWTVVSPIVTVAGHGYAVFYAERTNTFQFYRTRRVQ